MTSVKEQEAIRKLMVFLQEWDNAHRAARSCILDNFIKSNDGKTEPELELEFSQGASLFLARLTAWLRMTYMYSTCLNKLLKSIGIFLSAASGRRYLIEFLEIGGVLILLEVLGLNHLKEEDKRESVRLLQLVADGGRKYKELICESYGVQSLAEFLATSSSAEAQEDVQVLLVSLGRGNPKYQNQVYRGLVAVLPCASPHAQQLALQALGAMQVGRGPGWGPRATVGFHACPSYPGGGQSRPPCPSSRRTRWERPPPPWCSPCWARCAPRTRSSSAQTRPPCARGSPCRCTFSRQLPQEPSGVYGLSRCSILAKESAEVAEELIQLKVVHGLVVAMGNLDHVASQRHASISLEYFVHTFPLVEECVKKALGHTLFQRFMDSPETWYTKMDPIQAEELASNIVDIPKDMAMMQSTEGEQE
ncbi:armadillo-like helical domain containing protein 1 isoform X2 [Opisthocomus hoazin]|uniref:armadillo-like helical domain containing protein 1 isoform X2 n=1 Tax=Opisthocomus hoazin TaxID=30419 RepID=UPI003F530A19